jgi:hypothetical protein
MHLIIGFKQLMTCLPIFLRTVIRCTSKAENDNKEVDTVPVHNLFHNIPYLSGLSRSRNTSFMEASTFLHVHYRVQNSQPPFFSSTKESVRSHVQHFVTCCLFTASSLHPSPNPQAGGPPPVGCPRLLTQYIRSCPPYWRPSPPCDAWRRPSHSFINFPYLLFQSFPEASEWSSPTADHTVGLPVLEVSRDNKSILLKRTEKYFIFAFNWFYFKALS